MADYTKLMRNDNVIAIIDNNKSCSIPVDENNIDYQNMLASTGTAPGADPPKDPANPPLNQGLPPATCEDIECPEDECQTPRLLSDAAQYWDVGAIAEDWQIVGGAVMQHSLCCESGTWRVSGVYMCDFGTMKAKLVMRACADEDCTEIESDEHEFASTRHDDNEAVWEQFSFDVPTAECSCSHVFEILTKAVRADAETAIYTSVKYLSFTLIGDSSAD